MTVSLDDNVFTLDSKADVMEWLTKYVSEAAAEKVTEGNGFDVEFGEKLSEGSIFLSEIEGYKNDIKQINALIKEKKEALTDFLVSLRNQYRDNEFSESVIYWALHGTGIVNSYSVHPIELPFKQTCNQCGKVTHGKVIIKSWANLEELAKKGRGKDYPNIRYVLADPCKCRLESDASQMERFELQQKERKQRLRKLKTMPYKQYLQTDEWKETRMKALRRADFKCQLCGGGGLLNVHHNNYKNRGNEQTADLITLCADCHKTYHKIGVEDGDTITARS